MTNICAHLQVFHSALHPHVIKILETYASTDAFLEHYHTHYDDFLDGIFDFRAAVEPTVQCFTPLLASRRPCLSAQLFGGAMVPMIAIRGTEDGVAPSADILLEGLKIGEFEYFAGLRHVVLEAASDGIGEAVAALEGALTLGMVKRNDLFLTLLVGEDLPRTDGAEGLTGVVRRTLASGGVGVEGPGGSRRDSSLSYVDAMVLMRESGRLFDDNDDFSVLWKDAREAAASPAPAWDEQLQQQYPPPTNIPTPVKHNPAARLPSSRRPLVRNLGIGGHGPGVHERLALLLENGENTAGQSDRDVPRTDPGSVPGGVAGTGVGDVPDSVPSVFWGDLRAGDAEVTARIIELCREKGVQAFSLQHDGGDCGDVVLKRAEGAANYEFEDVTPEEVLAKWLLELGCGVVWRAAEPTGVWRTLPMLRYFMPPQWIT
ncbi:unnamed protein product, partial [Sphacelaria rigidula]